MTTLAVLFGLITFVGGVGGEYPEGSYHPLVQRDAKTASSIH